MTLPSETATGLTGRRVRAAAAGRMQVLLPAMALLAMLALIFLRQPRTFSYFGLSLLLSFALPLSFASLAQLSVIALGTSISASGRSSRW